MASAPGSHVAEQLYAAFRSVCPVDENGDMLPPLEQLEDGGRGWFAIANAVDVVAEPATGTAEPYDVELVPIAPRIAPDGFEIQESEDERPTKITIRSFTAADLCVDDYGTDRFLHAVFARAMGIDIDTVEWRMDPSDVKGGTSLCVAAGGRDAADLCRDIYFEGGGKQALADVPGLAWIKVAQVLLTETAGSAVRVRCRTPGVGTLTIGPIRSGHIRLYEGTAARETEWMGRMAAIAKASGRSLGMMLALRTEDAINAWGAFDALKKKAEQQPSTAIGARLSAMSSSSDRKNSTT